MQQGASSKPPAHPSVSRVSVWSMVIGVESTGAKHTTVTAKNTTTVTGELNIDKITEHGGTFEFVGDFV